MEELQFNIMNSSKVSKEISGSIQRRLKAIFKLRKQTEDKAKKNNDINQKSRLVRDGMKARK